MNRRTRLRRWLADRIRRPVDVVALSRYLAETLLVATVLMALVLQYNAGENRLDEKDAEIASLRTELEARAEVSDCRSRLAAAVSDETSSFLLALGDLVESLPTEDVAAVGASLAALTIAGDQLDAARDARVSFEADPTGAC